VRDRTEKIVGKYGNENLRIEVRKNRGGLEYIFIKSKDNE
jgi:hypothetical protein